MEQPELFRACYHVEIISYYNNVPISARDHSAVRHEHNFHIRMTSLKSIIGTHMKVVSNNINNGNCNDRFTLHYAVELSDTLNDSYGHPGVNTQNPIKHINITLAVNNPDIRDELVSHHSDLRIGE